MQQHFSSSFIGDVWFLNKQLLYFPFQQDIQRLQPGPYFRKALKLTVLMTSLRTKSCVSFFLHIHPSWLCMKEGSSSYWTSPMFSMTRIAVYENFLAGLNVLIWMLSDIVDSTPQMETLREREMPILIFVLKSCFVLFCLLFLFFCIAILQGIIIISHPSLKWYRFS